jgi:hypothetical protein
MVRQCRRGIGRHARPLFARDLFRKPIPTFGIIVR